MLSRDESVGINRLSVVGPDGENIGGVEAMYVDEATNEPEFALAGLGFFRLLHSFVPMEGARTEGDDLHVRYSKDMVKEAPYVHPGDRLDDQDVSALYRHYGIDPAARRSEPAPAAHAEPARSVPSEKKAAVRTGEPQAAEPGAAAPGPSADSGSQRSPEPVAATAAAVAAAVVDAQEELTGEAAPDGDDEPSLEDRTVDELRQMASDRDISGRSSMNKQELVEALSRSGGAGEQSEGRAYEDWTVEELRQLAADRDISGRSSMNKGALIDALRGR